MDQPKTMSVPAAGRIYYGVGRNLAYEAARRGEIPTIKVGRLLRVPIAAMERRLAEAGEQNDPPKPTMQVGSAPRRTPDPAVPTGGAAKP